jgi:ribosomal-protein-alanine N-acetyltransferase
MQSNLSKNFPIFDLGDVILREKKESDAEDFFYHYSNPKVNQFILCEMPVDIEQARKDIAYWRSLFYHGSGIYFAIVDKKNDKMIGAIGLSGFNSYQKRIEISYDLSPQYWRQGITFRAIAHIVKYAFDNYGVNRIEASVATANTPSKNLLIKSGFVVEGTLRQHRFHKGYFCDVYFLSMLRDDYNYLNYKTQQILHNRLKYKS